MVYELWITELRLFSGHLKRTHLPNYDTASDFVLLIWREIFWLPVCSVPACQSLSCAPFIAPFLLFPSLVSLWLSGLWVGKIWCCGNFYGHHQRDRTFSCSNMTGSQAARRHRSLVSNRWEAEDHIQLGAFSYLQEVVSWKNCCGDFQPVCDQLIIRLKGRKGFFYCFPAVSVVFNADLILVDGIFISTAISVGGLKYSSGT